MNQIEPGTDIWNIFFYLDELLKQFRQPCFYWDCFTLVTFYLSGSIYLASDLLNSTLISCVSYWFSFGSHYIFS